MSKLGNTVTSILTTSVNRPLAVARIVNRNGAMDLRWRLQRHACEHNCSSIRRDRQIIVESWEKGVNVDVRVANRDVITLLCAGFSPECDRMHRRGSFVLGYEIDL